MKKILKPQEQEEVVYYSDFSGKLLQASDTFGPPIEIKIFFNYGSKYDTENLELHLDDEDYILIKNLLKKYTTQEFQNTHQNLL
jgi:hypothetical protein